MEEEQKNDLINGLYIDVMIVQPIKNIISNLEKYNFYGDKDIDFLNEKLLVYYDLFFKILSMPKYPFIPINVKGWRYNSHTRKFFLNLYKKLLDIAENI